MEQLLPLMERCSVGDNWMCRCRVPQGETHLRNGNSQAERIGGMSKGSKHLKELDCEEENDGQEEETTGLKISAMNSVKALPKSRGGMVPALLCRRPPLVGSRPMGCREAWYKVLV
ncbi:hypothetical protein ACOSQ4_028980 [Xanthoceras sorbifolium]